MPRARLSGDSAPASPKMAVGWHAMSSSWQAWNAPSCSTLEAHRGRPRQSVSALSALLPLTPLCLLGSCWLGTLSVNHAWSCIMYLCVYNGGLLLG